MAKTRQTAVKSTGGKAPRKELNRLVREARAQNYGPHVVIPSNIPDELVEARVRGIFRAYNPTNVHEPFVVRYGDTLPQKESTVGTAAMYHLFGKFNTDFMRNIQARSREDLRLTEEEMLILGFQDVDVQQRTIDSQSRYWNALVFCDWTRPPQGNSNPKYFYMPREDYVESQRERGRLPGYVYAIRSSTEEKEGEYWRTQLCTVAMYSEEDADKIPSTTRGDNLSHHTSVPATVHRDSSPRPPNANQSPCRPPQPPSTTPPTIPRSQPSDNPPRNSGSEHFTLRGDETVIYVADSDDEQPLRRSSGSKSRKVFRRHIYNCVIDESGELGETDEAGSVHLKILRWLMRNPNRIWIPRAASYRDHQPETRSLHLREYPNPAQHDGRRCMIFSIQYAMARLTSMTLAARVFNGANCNKLRTFSTIALMLSNDRRGIFSLVKVHPDPRSLQKGHYVIHIRAKCMRKNDYGSHRGDVINHCVYADLDRRIIIDPVEPYAIPFHHSTLHYCVGQNYQLTEIIEIREVQLNIHHERTEELNLRLDEPLGSRKKTRRSIKKKRKDQAGSSSTHGRS